MSTVRRRFPRPYRALGEQSLDGQPSPSFPGGDTEANSQTINVSTNTLGSGSGGGGGGKKKSDDDFFKYLGIFFVCLILIGIGALITAYFCLRGPDDLGRPPPKEIVEGGACKNWEYYSTGSPCDRATRTELAFRLSLYWLNRGDASMAVGHRYNANKHWRRAAKIGRIYGAPTANLASERLAFLELNCPTSQASLDRLGAPPGDAVPLVPTQVTVAQRKKALAVLGFYRGVIDNTPDWQMRDAIMRFQTTLWFSPADGLRPEQTTLLICGAAQRGNAQMQDLLGSMFAIGQGVVQNTDSALYWFGKAAEQNYAEAHFHLAVLYGSGFVRSSTGLCGTTGTLERADNYLKTAAALGHNPSKRFVKRYFTSAYDVVSRWKRISADLGYAGIPPADNCR